VSALRGLESIVTQAGPMARQVEDLSLALQVLAGQEDGYVAGDAAPGPPPDPAAVNVRKLTVGVMIDDGVFPASAAIKRAVSDAARALRELGATVIELGAGGLPGAEGFFDLYFSLAGADGGSDARRLARGNKLDGRARRMLLLAGVRSPVRAAVAHGLRLAGQRWMARMVSIVRPLSADADRQLALRKQQLVRQTIDSLQARRIDAVICPPHALPAAQHAKGFYLLAAGSHSMLFNLLGFPAGVVSTTRVRPGEEQGRPASRDQVEHEAAEVDRGSAGLPVAVQVAALPWREDVVLAVMATLEGHFASMPDYPGRIPMPAAK
jgi:fatty acid amide hydrolase